jgi:hypothetical protein
MRGAWALSATILHLCGRCLFCGPLARSGFKPTASSICGGAFLEKKLLCTGGEDTGLERTG